MTDKTNVVDVHLAGIDSDIQKKLLPTTPVSRDRTVITNTYLLAVGQAVPILSHSPKRCGAQVIVNATTGAIIAFGTSQSDVQDAIATATGEFIGAVAYTVGPYGSPIPLINNGEMWAGLVVAGSGPTVLSVIKEFDT
jgi:hypothetical protein